MTTRAFTPALAVVILALLLPQPIQAKGPNVGDVAPTVNVQGVDGNSYSLKGFADAEAVVVVFTCRKCPVSDSYTKRLNELARRYRDRKVQVLAVNASDQLANSKHHAKRYEFPYAHDASGRCAQSFGARMTPEVFVVDRRRRIVYRGAFDNSQRRPTKHYVRDAVEATLAKRPIKIAKTDPFGCSLRLLAIQTSENGE